MLALTFAISDGKGHSIVDSQEPLPGPTRYGDGTTFNVLRTMGGGASGTESFSLTSWDSRVFMATNSSALRSPTPVPTKIDERLGTPCDDLL